MNDTSTPSRSARLLLGIAAVGGLLQAQAAYADAPASPPPAEAFSWTGAYIGADIGHTTGDATWYGPSAAGEFGGHDADTVHHRGTTYGGQVGYNYQMGHIVVVGLEASLHGTSQSAGHSYTGGEGYTGATAITVRNTLGGDVSARAGLAVEHLLVFGKLGYAFAKYDYSGTDNSSVAFSGSSTRTGLLAGGGIEYAITRHISVKAEYDHTTFSSSGIALSGSSSLGSAIPIGEKSDSVLFGVNYRF